MDPNAFVTLYYKIFDQDRSQLVHLYRDVSMLTFETTQHLGMTSIGEKLVGLPFRTVNHQVETTDVQPTVGDCFAILVTGELKVDEDRPLRFAQLFTLAPSPETPNVPFFIVNDIFRLSFPN